MSYTPADGGFAKYFFSMLDDRDRNLKYSEAIEACIAEFVRNEGRKPRVLDIGIGTGMLSALCIKHGAFGFCRVPDCTTPSRKWGGNCSKHGGLGTCSMLGCTSNVAAKGVCWKHRMQLPSLPGS